MWGVSQRMDHGPHSEWKKALSDEAVLHCLLLSTGKQQWSKSYLQGGTVMAVGNDGTILCVMPRPGKTDPHFIVARFGVQTGKTLRSWRIPHRFQLDVPGLFEFCRPVQSAHSGSFGISFQMSDDPEQPRWRSVVTWSRTTNRLTYTWRSGKKHVTSQFARCSMVY